MIMMVLWYDGVIWFSIFTCVHTYTITNLLYLCIPLYPVFYLLRTCAQAMETYMSMLLNINRDLCDAVQVGDVLHPKERGHSSILEYFWSVFGVLLDAAWFITKPALVFLYHPSYFQHHTILPL